MSESLRRMRHQSLSEGKVSILVVLLFFSVVALLTSICSFLLSCFLSLYAIVMVFNISTEVHTTEKHFLECGVNFEI